MTTRKAIFSKPKWAAASGSISSETSKPLFQHNVYEDIVATNKAREERRKQRKLQADSAKQRERPESHSSDDDNRRGDADQQSGGSASKRRKVIGRPYDKSPSVSVADSSDSSRASTPGAREVYEASQAPAAASTLSPNPATPPISPKPAVNHTESEHRESESGSDIVVVSAVKKAKPVTQILQAHVSDDAAQVRPVAGSNLVSDSESDEELRALRQAARAEKARKVVSPRPAAANSGSQHNSLQTSLQPDVMPPAVDPAELVQIWITSIIPQTRDLIVQRLLSQPLDKVRLFWCRRMELPPALADKVFFIWEGQKLFNSTTMRSVVEMIRRKHGVKPGGDDPSKGKITIEAVTQEIYEHRLSQRAQDRERKLYPEKQSGSEEVQTTAADAPTSGIVIRLVAPERPDFRLRVRPDTSIIKIVRGYTKKMNVPPDKQVYLVFEGDRLEGEQLVRHLDWEDGDTVDVQVV